MIIGELTTGTRIQLEKGPSRHHISEDQQFVENILEFLFCQIPEAAKTGGKGGPPWAHTMPWRGHPLGRAAMWCGCPGPPQPVPLCVLHPLETLRHGEPLRKYSATSTGRKITEREKISGREKSVGEIPSWRGEIIAIVTVIELYFIGIIIISISTTVTIVSTAPLRSAVTSRVESCTVLRGNSPGVDYYLWLVVLGGTVELGFMSRLLSIIISSPIMFPMMSCE